MFALRKNFPRWLSAINVALVSCSVLLAFSSCSKPNPALYGKWQEDGAKDITEFREDGTFSIGGAGRETMTGKYKFTAADRIKLELSGPEAKVVGPMICQVVVQGDTLDMTMPDGTK